jgi:hypothetical protein
VLPASFAAASSVTFKFLELRPAMRKAEAIAQDFSQGKVKIERLDPRYDLEIYRSPSGITSVTYQVCGQDGYVLYLRVNHQYGFWMYDPSKPGWKWQST